MPVTILFPTILFKDLSNFLFSSLLLTEGIFNIMLPQALFLHVQNHYHSFTTHVHFFYYLLNSQSMIISHHLSHLSSS
jgi:hypothetical protein